MQPSDTFPLRLDCQAQSAPIQAYPSTRRVYYSPLDFESPTARPESCWIPPPPRALPFPRIAAPAAGPFSVLPAHRLRSSTCLSLVCLIRSPLQSPVGKPPAPSHRRRFVDK